MKSHSHPAWVPVESSAISALTYDEQTETLSVRFKPSGTEYAYSNVTKAEHAALTGAESIGKYFNSYIKNTHEFRKLTEEGEE